MLTEKYRPCFYKNSTNQTSITPLENKVPTVIKCSVLLPDN